MIAPSRPKKTNHGEGSRRKVQNVALVSTVSMKRGGWRWEPVEDKEPRVVTPEEETKLIKAAKKLYGGQWDVFIKVAIATGGRRGELMNLEWRQVDLEGIVDPESGPSVLFKKTKARKDRRVPLSKGAADALRRLKAKTLQQGGPFDSCMQLNINRTWKRIITKAGIAYARIHDLRATFTTRAVRAGADVKHVQTLCGHAKVETTLRYYTSATSAAKSRAVIDAMAAAG